MRMLILIALGFVTGYALVQGVSLIVSTFGVLAAAIGMLFPLMAIALIAGAVWLWWRSRQKSQPQGIAPVTFFVSNNNNSSSSSSS